MNCQRCGKQLREGFSFCTFCGATQPVNTRSAGQERDARFGTVLEGKYRIEEKIGTGGMATVYRAERLMIGDFVAVKILHDEQLRDASAAKRFRREAQAAAKLKHINAVTVHDFGKAADGTTFLVMELVKGDSLRQLIAQEGPVSPSVAAKILTQACAALDAAHDRGIVHRDIKPDNIIVERSSNGLHVKVLDFGIARLRDMTMTGDLTQAGHVLGTPQYMSPEQCLGEELDGRSDTYSMGVVLYELLSGKVPFNASNSVSTIVKKVTEDPIPLRDVNASVSPAIADVVNRSLRRQRAKRPASAGELAKRFNDALNDASDTTSESETQSKKPTSGESGHERPDPASKPTVQVKPPSRTNNPFSGRGRPQRRSGSRGGTTRKVANFIRAQFLVFVAGIMVVSAGGLLWWFTPDAEEADSAETTAESPADQEPSVPDGRHQELQAASESPAGNRQPSAPAAEHDGASRPSQDRPAATDRAADSAASAPAPSRTPSNPPAAKPKPPPRVARHGRLTIRARPESLVQLDGDAVGTTGSSGVLSLAKVPPGRHLVVVRKDGYANAEATVEVITGRAEVVELSVVELPGMLTVTANTGDVNVQIEGVGERRLPITRLEVPAGLRRVTASKSGFLPVEESVDIPVGEVATLALVLKRIPVTQVLAGAQNHYNSRRYRDAVNSLYRVLNDYPESGEAYRLLGYSLYALRKYDDSTRALEQAIEFGQEVAIHTKHRHRGLGFRAGFCAGVVSLSKTRVAFRSTDDPDHNFSVTPDKILSVNASRDLIDTRISVVEGNRERKRNVDFIHEGTTKRSTDDAGIMTELRCYRCDSRLTVLGVLLQRVRRL